MKKESQQGKLTTEIDLQIDNILFININWFLDMWYILNFGSGVYELLQCNFYLHIYYYKLLCII